MDKCKNNINGHCRMFGRRENCEDCSEYCCEEDEYQEELPNLKKEEELTVREAFKEFIEKLTDKYLEDKGQRAKGMV